jgi:enamine deaminase RidA (YjgF/YER057c/UK114 family)
MAKADRAMDGTRFEKKHYNYGRWTKGRFSEAVTVTGPAKMIFLAGIGAEHEETGETVHVGDFAAQLRYAYRKLKNVLEKNGATMHDVVKQVTYVTDIRHWKDASQIRSEAYGDAPLPAHTFLNVNQLAFPGMLVEIDIIAMIPLES